MDFGQSLRVLQQNVMSLGVTRLVALAFVGLLVMAFVGVAALQFGRAPQDVVYTGLNQQDVSRVGSALSEFGIPFEVTAKGDGVSVPYGQASRARMLLAQRGLPGSATAGYELFDDIGSMGLTSFMQEVTRLRALEGEISRSLQSIEGVIAARVHLVMAQPGSFRREPQNASASVVVRLANPGSFAAATAIRRLVSAAVPGLDMQNVTVLTTDGAVLAAAGDGETMAPTGMVGLEATVGERFRQNVLGSLAPYLGVDNFRVSVAVDLNTDEQKTQETTFDPESQTERSTHIVRRAESARSREQGDAVGVEANLPAVDEEEPGAPGESQRSDERREEMINYELSRRTVSTVSRGYRVERLAVAVVVNRNVMNRDGTPGDAAFVTQQLAELRDVVAAAVGYDEARGDKITVRAVTFLDADATLQAAPDVNFAEHLARNSGQFVMAAVLMLVAILLIWFGLRPLARSLGQDQSVAVGVGDAALPSALDSDDVTTRLPINGNVEATDLAGTPSLTAEVQPAPTEVLSTAGDGPALLQNTATPEERLRELVEAREAEVAGVMKSWLSEAHG